MPGPSPFHLLETWVQYVHEKLQPSVFLKDSSWLWQPVFWKSVPYYKWWGCTIPKGGCYLACSLLCLGHFIFTNLVPKCSVQMCDFFRREGLMTEATIKWTNKLQDTLVFLVFFQLNPCDWLYWLVYFVVYIFINGFSLTLEQTLNIFATVSRPLYTVKI